MKYIANILTEKTFPETEMYNIVQRKEDLIEGIPTLVIGWEFAQSIYSNANILDWEIDDNTYWTFGNRERRNRYEECIKKFKEMAMSRMIKSIKYVYVNVLSINSEAKGKFFKNVSECTDNVIYIIDDMLYVYVGCTDIVYGISLRDLKYIGSNPNEIVEFINRHNGRELNLGEEWNANHLFAFKNKEYVIPYLYS